MAEESTQPELTVTETAERRDSARHAFICPAELIEINGGVCITARTADLSSNGCYVDTLNPLPVGTRVRIWLTKDRRIEFQARVASSQPGFGMGLLFEQLTPEQKATLQSWIAGTSVTANQEAVFRRAVQADSEAALKPNNKPFAARLVAILQRKGILTHSEAAELLRSLDS